MKTSLKVGLQRMMEEYDADYDVPPGPRIPWYIYTLGLMIQELIEENKTQQKSIDDLEDRVKQLELQSYYRTIGK
jgi:hypothetical protein